MSDGFQTTVPHCTASRGDQHEWVILEVGLVGDQEHRCKHCGALVQFRYFPAPKKSDPLARIDESAQSAGRAMAARRQEQAIYGLIECVFMLIAHLKEQTKHG